MERPTQNECSVALCDLCGEYLFLRATDNGQSTSWLSPAESKSEYPLASAILCMVEFSKQFHVGRSLRNRNSGSKSTAGKGRRKISATQPV